MSDPHIQKFSGKNDPGFDPDERVRVTIHSDKNSDSRRIKLYCNGEDPENRGGVVRDTEFTTTRKYIHRMENECVTKEAKKIPNPNQSDKTPGYLYKMVPIHRFNMTVKPA